MRRKWNRNGPLVAVLAGVAVVILLSAVFSPKASTVDPGNAVGRPPVPLATPQPAKYHRVAVIGDSYTAGTQYGGQQDYYNWLDREVYLLQKDGEYVELHPNTSGGSGYLNPGPNNVTFSQLVPRVVDRSTELTVVFGSRNDIGRPGLETAVGAVLDDIRLRAPASRIILISPPWVDSNVPAGLLEVNKVLREEGSKRDATFVDTVADGWFFGRYSALISADGIHPTDAGHIYMAQKLLPYFSSELRKIQ